MPPFKIHHILLGGRHYLLLPKLATAQVQVFVKRFEKLGCRVRVAGSVTATTKEGAVHISPSGYCWASFDPSDAVLPAIPSVLDAPKERVPLESLRSMYFRSARAGRGTIALLQTRVESSSLWDGLRAAGECGLTPDEHAIASLILRRTEGECEVVTDFPAEDSAPRICGRKRYYVSSIEAGEALATLRVAGARGPRNSYLKRDGTLGLGRFRPPTRQEWLDLFEGTGEWCSFAPA